MNFRATIWRWLTRSAMMLVATVVASGCSESKLPPEVVVYASVDREIALPILAEFTKSTGIKVQTKYATERTGSTGLAQEIVAEREHPTCDLFWNDEILNTLRLENEGLLRPSTASAANKFPADAHSPRGAWYEIATQARVLIVNTHQIAEARRPDSIDDLTDPQWYERTAIAKPLYGPSAVHVACLFQALGDDKAQELLRAIKRTARILASDREVAQEVATGRLAFGLTNSGDAIIQLAGGAPVTIVYPDQAEYQLGTLFIPSTVALVKNSPHAEPAAELLNYLLSPEVARRLADGPSALVPLETGVTASNRVKTPTEVRAMKVDFPAAAEHWDTVAKFLHEEFASP